MELSRQSAIKNMVAAGMGVGIVPFSTAREDTERGRIVRWWIEGARINWELGIARLSGGYLSPLCESFLELCREYFAAAKGAEETRTRRNAKQPRADKGGKRAAAAKHKSKS